MNEKKILVVEDDKDILETLQELLETEGYQVSTAVNGQIALDLLNSGSASPDLILVDLMMPVMDGFQFIEAQKNHEASKNARVVVMSANGTDPAKVENMGVKLFLRKPLDLTHFLNNIADQFVN